MKKGALMIIGCLIILVGIGVVILLFQEDEYLRVTSPDGKYTAIVTYRRYQALLPMGPGQSSDKPGFIRIEDSSGSNLGKIPLPMVQMAYDLEWTPTGAEIRLVGEWDFSRR